MNALDDLGRSFPPPPSLSPLSLSGREKDLGRSGLSSLSSCPFDRTGLDFTVPESQLVSVAQLRGEFQAKHDILAAKVDQVLGWISHQESKEVQDSSTNLERRMQVLESFAVETFQGQEVDTRPGKHMDLLERTLAGLERRMNSLEMEVRQQIEAAVLLQTKVDGFAEECQNVGEGLSLLLQLETEHGQREIKQCHAMIEHEERELAELRRVAHQPTEQRLREHLAMVEADQMADGTEHSTGAEVCHSHEKSCRKDDKLTVPQGNTQHILKLALMFLVGLESSFSSVEDNEVDEKCVGDSDAYCEQQVQR